jgi:hypothetical protein
VPCSSGRFDLCASRDDRSATGTRGRASSASRGWLALGAALGAATMLLNSGMTYLYGTLTGDRSIPVDRLAMIELLGGPLWQSLLMLTRGRCWSRSVRN